MLRVFTAQYNYQGADRFDVTAKGNDPHGRSFAPTWDLLMGWKRGKVTNEQYIEAYYDLMRSRYRENPQTFKQLLEKHGRASP